MKRARRNDPTASQEPGAACGSPSRIGVVVTRAFLQDSFERHSDQRPSSKTRNSEEAVEPRHFINQRLYFPLEKR
jgi:hypothetical protein